MSVIEELYAKFLEPECLSEIVSFDTRTFGKVTWHLHWNLPEPDLGVAFGTFHQFPSSNCTFDLHRTLKHTRMLPPIQNKKCPTPDSWPVFPNRRQQ